MNVMFPYDRSQSSLWPLQVLGVARDCKAAAGAKGEAETRVLAAATMERMRGRIIVRR